MGVKQAEGTSGRSYPIRAAARLAGLTPDTLRAWERRYAAITPAREGRGRSYSDADVARLRLLHQVVSAGYQIGSIAHLSNDALQGLADGAAAAPARTRMRGTPIDPLLDAIDRYDTAAVEREMSRLAAALPPRALVHEAVMPALHAIGDAWETGRLRAAQEHLVSATIRHVLGGQLRAIARHGSSDRLLFATLSGERHEFGILSAALLAAGAGADVVYLGPDLPAEEIAGAARDARATTVVIGLTSMSGAAAARQLAALSRLIEAPVEIWAGGAGTPDRVPPRVVVTGTLEEFEARVAALQA